MIQNQFAAEGCIDWALTIILSLHHYYSIFIIMFPGPDIFTVLIFTAPHKAIILAMARVLLCHHEPGCESFIGGTGS